ncbi:hypothetical protein [Branchiibius cervicis]|uniref:Uncharacterized protein n=1 Tax=Branchiibius cervicis TaxID=908252 RepID=A0ABW2AWD1_9MICO
MGGDENVSTTAGIWGFIILFALALACWLLFRSMNNRLRKVRYSAADEARDREAIEVSEATGESERQAAIELDEERLEEKGEITETADEDRQ